MIRISVVIGTYNLWGKLKYVLDSFSKQTFKSFELIVVDSESDDETSEMIKKFDYPFELRYFIVQNKGKAAARNYGIRQARGEIIFLTDADMIAHPNLLEAHNQMQLKNKDNVLLQGKTWVLNAEKMPPENYLRRPYIKKKILDGQKLSYHYCLTGNLSVPKHFFELFGVFDEEFKNYGWEDIMLGYVMLNRHRCFMLYCSKAENYHFHVWSDAEEVLRKEKMGASVQIAIKKYPELKMTLGINPLNLFLYKILSKPSVEKWLGALQKGHKLNFFKKFLLNEYYFQKGYYAKIN